MDAILGYNWQDLLKVYQIVCIMVDMPNHSRSIALSVVAGYPVGEV